MKRVAIFGCGGAACELTDRLISEGDNVVGFADNNDELWGTSFYGREVFSPEQLRKLSIDSIVIAVFKAADVIKEQLEKMGFCSEMIFIYHNVPKIFPLPHYGQSKHTGALDSSDYVSVNTQAYNLLAVQVQNIHFKNKLDQLKKTLEENYIDRRKVCVTAGAVLQVLGLRKSKKYDDIDVIMTSDLREVYGKGLVIVNEFTELHPQDLYDISDDEIILNRNNYFVYYDLKFVHPYILYRNKKQVPKYAVLKDFEGLYLGGL